jgi:1-pyrroline-5-carboxylate dehydrogenase
MFDAVTQVPSPVNEPVHTFAPGSPERAALEARLKQVAAEPVELTMTIGGDQRLGDGDAIDIVQPHRKTAVLGKLGNATTDDVRAAVEAARAAAPAWQRMSYAHGFESQVRLLQRRVSDDVGVCGTPAAAAEGTGPGR